MYQEFDKKEFLMPSWDRKATQNFQSRRTDTIRENDYNLNIPRYDSSENAESWDIYVSMLMVFLPTK
jgi:type I restriction-modification system DNA methylase subunit